jgi:hypothetical protein
MAEEKFDPLQSLQLIENMINRAKNSLSDNGHLYLLWGWVVLACSLIHFAAINWQLWNQPEMIWLLTWGALIYQMIYLSRREKKKQVNSYADEILKAVWLVFVGCGGITGFVISRNGSWEAMYPLILMLYGIPTILSGTILRFKPLVAGGIICWVLSIAGVFLPLLYNLLLVSVAVFCAWIIPGYLLQKRFEKEHS